MFIRLPILISDYFRRYDQIRIINPKRRLYWHFALDLDCAWMMQRIFFCGLGTLFRQDQRDLIVQFFIEQKKYDLDAVNDALIEFGEKELTSF